MALPSRAFRRLAGPLAGAATLGLAAAATAAPPRVPEHDPAAREARIAEIVVEIRREQARVAEWISSDTERGWRAPALRRAAETLPALQRELADLGGRDALKRAPSSLP